jgi:hypothetical protein
MNRDEMARYHERFIQQLFRVFKLSEMHDAQNQAVARGAHDAIVALNELGQHSGGALSALFDGRDVFLNGQPLLARRQVYEQSRALGARLEALGANELLLDTPLNVQDMQNLVAHQQSGRALQGVEQAITPRIRLRKKEANPYTQLSHDLPPQELVARSGAAALVVIERLYEGLLQGDYNTVRYAKRIARNIVLLGERYPRLLLGFISSCPDRGDVATMAVKGAILSTLALGQLTRDVRNLTDMALTALLHDVGMIRACGLMQQAEQRGLVGLPAVAEQALERYPEASAAMMTLFGSMGEASLARSVYMYEGHHIRLHETRGMPYDGELPPTVEGLILATSRNFLTHWMSLQNSQKDAYTQPMVSLIDGAIAQLEKSANSNLERLVISLLLRGMGISTRGTLVELSSGWRGVVVANHERPACFSRPIVRLVVNPRSEVLSQTRDVDLSLPTHEAVLLGCVVGHVVEEEGSALSQAREAMLSPPKKKKKRLALDVPAPTFKPPSNNALMQEQALDVDEDNSSVTSEEDESLAILESLSQIRRAPWLPIPDDKPSVLQEIDLGLDDDDDFTSTSRTGDTTGNSAAWRGDSQPLAWDDRDNTSHSLPSDRHQILNIADIAHMIPDEMADQSFEPIDYTEAHDDAAPQPSQPHFASQSSPGDLAWGPREGTDFRVSTNPISLSPETWNKLLDEVGPEDGDDTGSVTSVSENKEQLFMLSGSFDVGKLVDDQGPATTLLPASIIDAFQYRDRREHEERSESYAEMVEVEVEPLSPSEIEELERGNKDPDPHS